METQSSNEVSNDAIQRVADELKQTRDEIKLKANLGKAELRDRWETLEKKFEEAQGEVKQLGDDAKDKADEARLRLKLHLKNLGEQYDELRQNLADKIAG